MGDPQARVEFLRDERIPDSEEIDQADRDALLDFSDELYLRAAEYSDHRHEKLLRHCVRMAEEVGALARALEDREATEDVVRWINRTYDNEETNRDYRVALRMFGKHAGDADEGEIPDTIDWVSGQTSRSYDPQPDPTEMLHWEEHVLPMIEATHNNRDAAIIAVAWDAGCRSGELRSLEVGDITDHKHGLQIVVDGKTGQRSVTLIPSVPHLQRWLQDHPSGADGDPLWTKLHSPEPISFRMFKKLLEEAADRAGVHRPVTLTNFRKSSASHLASQGMSQAHIEEHHGWKRGSAVAARYVQVFAEDAERELARIHGKDVEPDEPDPIAPVPCPRCGRDTPREKEFCVWCDQAIDRKAVRQVQLDERRVQRVLLGLAKKDPTLLQEAAEREDVINALEGNPEVMSQARQFLDELDIDVGSA